MSNIPNLRVPKGIRVSAPDLACRSDLCWVMGWLEEVCTEDDALVMRKLYSAIEKVDHLLLRALTAEKELIVK